MTAASTRAIQPVLVGLNGWYRYGSWSAHFYVDGQQQCHTNHGNFNGATMAPKRPEPAELSRHRMPFGRVCARCLKVSRLSPLPIGTGESK